MRVAPKSSTRAPTTSLSQSAASSSGRRTTATPALGTPAVLRVSLHRVLAVGAAGVSDVVADGRRRRPGAGAARVQRDLARLDAGDARLAVGRRPRRVGLG